jgi:hypothetical protein
MFIVQVFFFKENLRMISPGVVLPLILFCSHLFAALLRVGCLKLVFHAAPFMITWSTNYQKWMLMI